MNNKLTDNEVMDLIYNWFKQKSVYEIWKLLPSHMLEELISIILRDNDDQAIIKEDYEREMREEEYLQRDGNIY